MSTQSILISEFSSASTWYCEMVDSLEVGSSVKKQPVAPSQQRRARSVQFSNIVSINNSSNTTVLNESGIGQAQSAYQRNWLLSPVKTHGVVSISTKKNTSYCMIQNVFPMSTQSILISEFSSASTWYCEMVDSLEIGSATAKEPVAPIQQPRARSVRFSDTISITNSSNVIGMDRSEGDQIQSSYHRSIRESTITTTTLPPSSSSST
ncbi:hypothetical protein PHYBLDRAFT_138347 [Phycomyces blakesleeanus NRRL 1555(-)]|uniref:Uncharacterized protein n=1 Tax=Phycomyces blakesleeanus (strain ATCC 8743b / DSM 1359 / FGSC 10004 / NBRC 33097 / NRRL 1555) TaxID=763407 RepID=A0A167R3Y7_PHYB8|nr:hypothetical protein PHYBLDRAFT_138347 [Phycomyces blakesleeanus NRRL 1555(-)]OAD80794.1 hypothetical protein PHYBLDRAFT_138347 [Phycomyces blakesleeanus NRRL 1555(-)]|eukprot:XP_018298834.1 hypothetical protein PHYBLDRAFT_138347 [Phycomyces blakesleeanus NRRL 1555(-)]